MRILSEYNIKEYSQHLKEQEKGISTIKSYTHNLLMAKNYFGDMELTKTKVIKWKEFLINEYAVSTVNAFLSALNSFFKFMGWSDLTVKPLKVQKSMFCDENKELTRDEYTRLVRAAESEGNHRLSLLLQIICSTGIRVSELKFITVEAVRVGRVEIFNKGKRRIVFLPDKLKRALSRYIKETQKEEGPVFTTRSGKPLDRSNIWRDMKALCESAGVDPNKVFPHNLCHLFARTYYTIEKDLSRLADILGHSYVNTTRIYTMESGAVNAHQIERPGLVIT